MSDPKTVIQEWLEVESLDLDGQGVARRADGKVVFIDGALPGEIVQASIARRKNNWEQGQMTALARESALRVRAASCMDLTALMISGTANTMPVMAPPMSIPIPTGRKRVRRSTSGSGDGSMPWAERMGARIQ